MKNAESYLASLGITQYRTKPKVPKEKPFVQRFTCTLQRECLDYHYEPVNGAVLREAADSWPDKYHFSPLELLDPGRVFRHIGLIHSQSRRCVLKVGTVS